MKAGLLFGARYHTASGRYMHWWHISTFPNVIFTVKPRCALLGAGYEDVIGADHAHAPSRHFNTNNKLNFQMYFKCSTKESALSRQHSLLSVISKSITSLVAANAPVSF